MEAQEIEPPFTSASEYPDRRLESLFSPPPCRVPDLVSWPPPVYEAAQNVYLKSLPPRHPHLPIDHPTTSVGESWQPSLAANSCYLDRRRHLEQQQVNSMNRLDSRYLSTWNSADLGPDFSDMATPEWSYSSKTSARSAVDSAHGGSEEIRSEPSKRRDRHRDAGSGHGGSGVEDREGNEAPRSESPRWPCQSCDKSFFRQSSLRIHERIHELIYERKIHKIPSETAKNVHQEAEAQDVHRMFAPHKESYSQPCPSQLRLESSFESVPYHLDGEDSGYTESLIEAHPSRKDEAKLMNYQVYDTTDGSDDTRVSKKRENPDDDASHCSGTFSSEEGDNSDGECDNITTWNCSQRDAPPSFLPYIRGHDADTSSPCGDSPDSESSTISGTTSNTPASSASGLTGGNGLQGNGYTSPSAGIGASKNSNGPILGLKDGAGPNFVSDPQPLPLICWYSAAGIACTAKYVKMSTEVRHLWNDHAWGKSRQGPNHRLSDACQRCKRLFLTQQLLEDHVRDIAPQGPCRVLSSVELEDFNREPNRLGISLECKETIDDLRKRIEKETKGDKMPALHDSETMALLKQRVDSNVLLYINGSNTSEKTARSQLWRWYLIFKKLRPDDEIPKNPFVSTQRLSGPEERPRADARRMFMRNLDQEECLSELDDDQRTALGRVLLNTLEMLGANEANERHRSVQTRRNPRKRQKPSPPEHRGLAPASTNLILAPTTPALAPAPEGVEFSPSVPNPVNYQHPTFTLPKVQNQMLPQMPSFVPQSFMSSADDFWQVQQQEEAEDAHSLFPAGNFSSTNPSTDYAGLPGFGTRDC